MKTKTKTLEALLASLPTCATWDFVQGELVKVQVKPYAFIRDGAVRVSAENGDCLVDYYGVSDGDPYICPELQKWAKDNGGFWEWENPGCIGFYV